MVCLGVADQRLDGLAPFQPNLLLRVSAPIQI
jgi:hypothetical protein